MSSLRDELIQVAAVAMATVQDLDLGGTDLTGENESRIWDIVDDVVTERVRQEELWGSQHHPMAVWMTILGEEYGEACQAALDEVIFPEGVEQGLPEVNWTGTNPTNPPIEVKAG